MKFLILCLLLSPFCTGAQIINTFAGGGATLGDGGAAIAALINDPCQLNFDKNGNLYIPCGVANRVRKIDTSGIITTIAGTGASGYNGDNGLATSARLRFPDGIALDTIGNLFIADGFNHAIRMVDMTTGIITTICGDGSSGYSGDNGPALAAKLYAPGGICFDKAGNLYIADCDNNVIRKINTSGIITTFAGTGVYGYNGDGIAATSAKLYLPSDVQADDSGNIYIADQGNARIRKVDTSGMISTYAGNGIDTFIGDGMQATSAQFTPWFIKFDYTHNLYIADQLNDRVYVVNHYGAFHTIAGNGTAINSGDGEAAINSSLNAPVGVAIDKCNNLYIGNVAASGDSDRIRKVLFNPACWAADVQNVTNAYNVNIYPNPAYNELTITTTEKINNVSIYNLIGQEIYNQHYNTEKVELNIASFPAGVYMVSITDNEGNKTVKKFIKE